jgi:glycosyltransferase involved in cell wall biosynthesis
MAKILLSAFVCRPDHGSEPGIGWHWAVELVKQGHEVWVLTQSENRPAIESELRERPVPNLRVLYYRLPSWIGWWRKGERGLRSYYVLWQWGAYHVAKRWHVQEHFDLVHHITFGVVRHPSFMGNLGIPFIFGPVGGGERGPWRLRKGYGIRGWCWDFFRDLANALSRIDPLLRRTFRQAEQIYVRTPQSRSVIPRIFWSKTRISLGTGVNPAKSKESPIHRGHSQGVQVLYVGRFIDWKGMYLGLAAFDRLLQVVPDAHLTMIGRGKDERRWRQLANTLNLNTHITWIPWISQPELFDLYGQHDIFLFPSLHDAGPTVVLEAMAHGLPVVCLDLGGTGKMVNESCGRVIPTQGRSATDVIELLGEALVALAANQDLRNQLKAGALERVQEYTWTKVVRQVYQHIPTL